MQIRLATLDDASACLAIYSHYIENTAVTFEITVPRVAEFQGRIDKILQFAPWLVCEEKGRVVGYAYAGRHRDREAYQWSVEASVYVAKGFQRMGIARKLYGALFAVLREQGFVNAYAGITLPNEASVKFHESVGFRHLGTYSKIGYKAGAWCDVGWWELQLSDRLLTPVSVKPLRELVVVLQSVLDKKF